MENLTAIDAGRATPSVQRAVEVKQVAEAAQVAAEPGRISEQQVQQSVAKINHFFENSDYGLNFSIDNDTGRDVIKVTDRESGDVIRQLPSEAIMKLSRAVGDLQGFLIKEIV